MSLRLLDNTTGDEYTVLRYEKVPLEVAEALDAAMDDGLWWGSSLPGSKLSQGMAGTERQRGTMSRGLF
ncbi:hypothetical protein M1O50_04220 [Dehalococcoidia bacterium]|nr:hypothetical protein [Dehalococcoidia bacterium]